jgi:hypothetical protein
MRQSRDDWLRQMRKRGFYSVGRTLRHDPIPWDINCGECEDFAMAVLDRLAAMTGLSSWSDVDRYGRLPDGTEAAMVWLDEVPDLVGPAPPQHCLTSSPAGRPRIPALPTSSPLMRPHSWLLRVADDRL